MNILITGAAGFIGSHVAEHFLRLSGKDCRIVCVDKLSYASKGWSRLKDSAVYYSPKVKCVTWDLCVPFTSGIIEEIGEVDTIIHMAADTHVDNSISDPKSVIMNNIQSTLNILEWARTLKNLKNFQYFSTDEVYGPTEKIGSNLTEGFKEWDVHRPSNPYSASKSASEQICLAYYNTYKLPIMITNLMNVYGERQHVEKFIPSVIKKLMLGEVIDIHTEGDGITPGSRCYIHARNAASATMHILYNGVPGEKYNITGEKYVNNLELALLIAEIMGKELKYKLVSNCANRPGHDPHYGLDGSKLKSLGWTAPKTFEESIRKTVEWTVNNPEWLNT